MARTRVKICCMQTPDEVRSGVLAGADAVGFVALGLSGPEVRDNTTISALAQHVPPGVDAWLLTRESDPHTLTAQVHATRATTVQLCDAMPVQAYAALREHCPWLRIVQVLHVHGPQALDDAQALCPHVDAFVLDSGVPSGPNPVYGGTGTTHDWAISAQVVAHTPKPVWLAGGLNADNVAQAIAKVRPYGVDLCSGVRTKHALVPAKLTAFMRAVHQADTTRHSAS